MKKLKIGVLISGGGTNLQAIIDACESGKINGEVAFVGSDRPDVFGLERAEKHKIPNFVVDYSERLKNLSRITNPLHLLRDLTPKDYDFNNVVAVLSASLKDGHKLNEYWFAKLAIIEAALLKKMAKHEFDLLVLAGFMRILTPYFIDKINVDPYHPRIMNIHPALLPSFPGTDGYGDTWRYGCTVGGCTVHFVDYGEDTGPIIRQRAINILPGETLESFKERGLAAEHELYPECIQLFAASRLKVIDRDIGQGRTKKVVEILPEKKPMEVLDEGADFKFMGIEDCPHARCGK